MMAHYATREQLQSIIDHRAEAKRLSREALVLSMNNQDTEARALRQQADALRKAARRASRALWGN